jgi:hypothetical protein
MLSCEPLRRRCGTRPVVASVSGFEQQSLTGSVFDAESSQEIFQRRLQRVTSGRAPKHVIWVGSNEAYAMPERARPGRKAGRRAGGGSVLRNAIYPLARVWALVLGFLSYGLEQVARYQVSGLPDPTANPDMDMVVQVIGAFAIAMVLGHFLGLRGRNFSSLKSLGAALGLLAFHNLVHVYPQVFDRLTSPMWVTYVVTHTKAHSLVWRGISFVL